MAGLKDFAESVFLVFGILGSVLVVLLGVTIWLIVRVGSRAVEDDGELLPDVSLQHKLARPAGIEPATPALEGQCSIQLSYGRGENDSSLLRRCGHCLVPLQEDEKDSGDCICVNSDCPHYLTTKVCRCELDVPVRVGLGLRVLGGVFEAPAGPVCKTCRRSLHYSSDLDLYYCETKDCPDLEHVQLKGADYRASEAVTGEFKVTADDLIPDRERCVQLAAVSASFLAEEGDREKAEIVLANDREEGGGQCLD
jgi:hypothetical protein